MINEITDLIILNRDSIFFHNGLGSSVDNRNQGTKNVNVFCNSLNQTLPPNIVFTMSELFNKLPSQMIFATTIYNNGNIVYSIRSKQNQSKLVNYKVQHRLIYGKRKSTNRELRSVMDVLSKDLFIDQYQYYIKVEPNNGW